MNRTTGIIIHGDQTQPRKPVKRSALFRWTRQISASHKSIYRVRRLAFLWFNSFCYFMAKTTNHGDDSPSQCLTSGFAYTLNYDLEEPLLLILSVPILSDIVVGTATCFPVFLTEQQNFVIFLCILLLCKITIAVANPLYKAEREHHYC